MPDWKKPQVRPAPTPARPTSTAPKPTTAPALAPKPLLGIVGGGASQFGGSVYRRGSAPTHGGGGGGGGAGWSPAKVAQLIATMDDVDWGKVVNSQ